MARTAPGASTNRQYWAYGCRNGVVFIERRTDDGDFEPDIQFYEYGDELDELMKGQHVRTYINQQVLARVQTLRE